MSDQTLRRTVAEQQLEWRCGRKVVLDAIHSGELVATKVGGRWLIDPEDAKAYEEARKNRVPTVRRARRPRRRVA